MYEAMEQEDNASSTASVGRWIPLGARGGTRTIYNLTLSSLILSVVNLIAIILILSMGHLHWHSVPDNVALGRVLAVPQISDMRILKQVNELKVELLQVQHQLDINGEDVGSGSDFSKLNKEMKEMKTKLEFLSNLYTDKQTSESTRINHKVSLVQPSNVTTHLSNLTGENQNQSAAIKVLGESLDSLEDYVTKNQSESINNLSKRLKTTGETVSILQLHTKGMRLQITDQKEEIVTLRNATNGMRRDLNVFENITDVSLRIQHDLEYATEKIMKVKDEYGDRISLMEPMCGGTYVWKIHNYTVNKNQSKVLESQPFYSENYGYRLRVLAYLDGHGTGEGTHLSLFYKLVPGQFDDVLQWPFVHDVQFTVLSQERSVAPVSYTAHVTAKSLGNYKAKIFDRPHTPDSNRGWGYSKYAPHADLENAAYVKNDVIYIKVEVIYNVIGD